MTYKFSEKSKKLLLQCDKDIQAVCNELIKYIDFSVLKETIRTKEEQAEFVKSGKSKTMSSKHLLKPSKAIDIAPYPIDWTKLERFYYLAGYFMGIAEYMKFTGKIKSSFRWGGDWNKNNDFSDEKFRDFVHLEII